MPPEGSARWLVAFPEDPDQAYILFDRRLSILPIAMLIIAARQGIDWTYSLSDSHLIPAYRDDGATLPGESSTAGRAPGVVIKRWRFVGYPAQESGDLRVVFQRFPGTKALCQLTLTEGGVNLPVADAVNPVLLFAALAARHKVVLVNAGADFKWPAAQGTQFWPHWLDVAKWLTAAQRTFRHHGLAAPLCMPRALHQMRSGASLALLVKSAPFRCQLFAHPRP